MSVREWALKKSPWAYHFCVGGGCNGCDIEVLAALTPKYDAERFGVVLKHSPKHADVLLVTGSGNKKSLKRALRVYEQVPEPKKVVAIGACACSMGVFQGSETLDGPVSKHFHVDAFVPGCPPRPEAILDALYKVLGLGREVVK